MRHDGQDLVSSTLAAVRKTWPFAIAILAFLLISGCAVRPPLMVEEVRRLPDRDPVVLVPGITGSRLRDPETGRLIWGGTRNLFGPHDGGASLALPLSAADGDGAGPVPDGILLELRMLGLRFDVYGSLVRTLERHGYRTGNLTNPGPDEDLLVFSYDWRQGNVEAAAALAQGLERLRAVRGEDRLRVHLICQSNAVSIARYVLRYGGASLEQAESGSARPPSEIDIRSLMLVGTASGGALGTLEELHRGRKYVPLFGRRLEPETVFSLRSIYESLPVGRNDLFVDSDANVLDVDLMDPADWIEYGLSVFEPSTRRRLESRRARRGHSRGREPTSDPYLDHASRVEFLAQRLDRAVRVQAVLRSETSVPDSTRIYSIQNAYRPTPDRVVLDSTNRGWRLRFPGDRSVRRDARLYAATTLPGDGHATVASQDELTSAERDRLARSPVYVQAPHREIIGHPAAHRWILEFLALEAKRRGPGGG